MPGSQRLPLKRKVPQSGQKRGAVLRGHLGNLASSQRRKLQGGRSWTLPASSSAWLGSPWAADLRVGHGGKCPDALGPRVPASRLTFLWGPWVSRVSRWASRAGVRDGLGYKDRPLSGPSLFLTQPETRPWLSFIYCNLMWAFWGQRKVSYSLTSV